MNNFDKLVYTYKHRKILKKLVEKYCNDKILIEKAEIHDLDKMYLLLFYDKKEIEEKHRSLALHHDNLLKKSRYDYIEMILDWESARYTKPDKPLNAYNTLKKFYPHLIEKLLPIMKELKLDNDSDEMEKDIYEYALSLNVVTEKDIKEELINYIDNL